MPFERARANSCSRQMLEPVEMKIVFAEPPRSTERATHVSGRSRRTTQRRWRFVTNQLDGFTRGEPLENVVT